MCLGENHQHNSLRMPERKSPRHPFFDYRSCAAYFVTTCTKNRRCLEVNRGRMYLNSLGSIVAEEWVRSQKLRDEIVLDAWIIMPNHLHGIVCIVPPEVDSVTPYGYDLYVGPNPLRPITSTPDGEGTTRASSLRREGARPKGPPAQSLSAMVGEFKSAVSRRYNRRRNTQKATVWQPRFDDRIIRNEEEWNARRRYIEKNPGKWHRDRYAPNIDSSKRKGT